VALDTRTGNRVAVKEFALDRVREWKQLDLFKRECQVLRRLRHPGIPQFVDEVPSPDGKKIHLIMELVPGESLGEVAAAGPLGEAELWRVMWQMAEILAYLHSQNPPVIHRDVKPRNIVRRPDGDLVLVDFGVASHGPPKGGGATFVGTFGFMAPEQFHGESSPATDLFGLGATLVALGTGREPEELPREGLRIRFEDSMQVSAELAELLHQMLEPEPTRRPQNGTALKQRLESASRQRAPARLALEDEGTAYASLPPPLALATGILLTVIGITAAVGLTVMHAALVPLLFTLLAAFLPNEKRPLLQAREQQIRTALQSGAASFRQLSKGGLSQWQRSHRALQETPRPRRLQGKRRG
jgi:serine/threonine protein kinase